MELMSGNEAIAQGAWEAGCTIGVAYPGTPSTETLEAFAKKEGVYAEWCVNEKVAVEVGIGASAAGARVLATMKHVGVNVAADPLFTAAYTGVGGGMVILAADDPGMYSSQNEQDSHYYAQAAAIPCLDPADSAEALRFTREAYDISERFDVPVIIRSSVRISHTKTPVEAGERAEAPARPYEKNPAKWVMMPAFAKPRRLVQLDRIDKLRQWVETCPYNEVIEGKGTVGVVCAGAAYQHVAEALPDASIFKLGVTWPLPAAALRDFADSVEAVYVVEEGSEYLKDAVRACGVPVSETPCPLPRAGELSPGLVRAAFGLEQPPHAPAATDLPGRPPALCPGCPHRLVFKELSRMRAIVTGDIGCYTLGALPPLSAMDTTVDMGASVSMAHGFELALAGTEHRPIVAVIGTPRSPIRACSLISMYNRGAGTVCVLDNRTTAMTGAREPLQRRDPAESAQPRLNIEAVWLPSASRVRGRSQRRRRRATGLKEATGSDDISVIVFRSPCVLLERHVEPPLFVSDSCTACGACVTLGCPALGRDETGRALIDPALCIGCGHCTQYCRFDAIVQE
ncbi:MAG: 4Fe-4S binding protein [Adlercreutzia sp.]